MKPVNEAFERRVLDAYLFDGELPSQAPITAYPEALRKHGAVVLHEAAARRRMVKLHAGLYCRRCAAWFLIDEDTRSCPACRTVWPLAEGTRWVAVVRPNELAGRGEAKVHAMATERWIRRDRLAFERRAGEFLCRSDRFTRREEFAETIRPVTCETCLKKLEAHLGQRKDVA